MTPKLKTLDDLVAEHGSQEEAARACGVVTSTFGRWQRGETRWPPRGRAIRDRLKELGVLA